MSTFASLAPAITSPDDSGAIIITSLSSPSPDEFEAVLRLKPEPCLEPPGSTFKQWFNFAATNLPVGRGTKSKFSITDAGESTYNDWNGYKVCATYDRRNWFRVKNTSFVDGQLTWSLLDSEVSSVQFAYFPTYSLERQLDLVYRTQATGLAKHRIIGKTVENRDLHCLVFQRDGELNSQGKRKFVIWIQHRQHPGEVGASWFCEGVIRKLLELSSESSAKLLDEATVYVIPNCNPDGSVLGHLRTNASGANLNRCWGDLNGLPADSPGQSDPKAPETLALIETMKSLGGVDLLLDIHQDEQSPYVFISKTPYGSPACTPQIRESREKYLSFLRDRSIDFMTPGYIEPVGYPEPAAGKANLNICSAAVAQGFPGCLAMTMEMPYKGNVNRGGKYVDGFSVDQCVDLGTASVEAVEDILPFMTRRGGEAV